MNEKISVFGSSGFVGSSYVNFNPEQCISIEREDNKPKSNNVLYFISTIDNYNVYDNPHLDVNTNLTKLIDVLEECRKLENVTFNFISSWFVYGKTDQIPVKETACCNPSGFYSITKLAAEQLLKSYCNTFDMDYRILRLTNIIGSNDKKVSAKKNALQYMINLLRENKEVKLYDNGEPIRDFMHVSDCCRAINTVINTTEKNFIVNISNSNGMKIGDIINYAKDKLNSTSKITHIPAPNFHKSVQSKDFCLDNSRLLGLQYKPSVSVFDAVNMILENQ